MIAKNIMIITEGSEEQMQGVIRGIEAMDTDHQIGIVYGTNNSKGTTEVELILADLANALIIKTPNVQMMNHPQGKEIHYRDIEVPDEDRDAVINYMKNKYPTIVEDIIKN